MLNTYLFQDNEILIEAPGSANKNRIKNDLIWDINNHLIAHFSLYELFVSKKPSDSVVCRRLSRFPEKYIAFQKLDDMFIKPTVLTNDEIKHYREIMDPLRKMDNDVFSEACCIENADIEYVAVESQIQLLNALMTSKPITALNRRITSLFPIYVSLFGSKEMRVVINQCDLVESVKEIVVKHCIKKT